MDNLILTDGERLLKAKKEAYGAKSDEIIKSLNGFTYSEIKFILKGVKTGIKHYFPIITSKENK
jgi:hypothetical protein